MGAADKGMRHLFTIALLLGAVTGCSVTDRYVVERSTIAPLVDSPIRLPSEAGNDVRQIGSSLIAIQHTPHHELSDTDYESGARHHYEVSFVGLRNSLHIDALGALRDPIPRDSETAWQLEQGTLPRPLVDHRDTPEAIDAIA